MGSIALPALGVKTQQPESPLEQYARLIQIKQMKQQGQMQGEQLKAAQLSNQEGEMNLKSRKVLMDAYTQAGGDLSKALPIAAQNGADPQSLIKLQESAKKQQMDNIALLNAKGARAIQEADLMQGVHDQISKLPPEQRPAAYSQGIQTLANAGVDTSRMSPQYPGDEAFQLGGIALKGHKQQLEDLAKQEEIRKTGAQADEAAAAVPGKVADSTMKVQEAALPPAARALKNSSALEYYAAKGDPDAQAALQKKIQVAQASRPVNMMGGGQSNAKDIADAIVKGEQPPDLGGLGRGDTGLVRGELARQGYDLVKATTDWKAVQKQIATLNGPQQTRLRQSIQSAGDMLDKVEQLYSEWKSVAPQSGFKILNKASLAAMKQMPGRAGAVAQALDAQVADLTADLGNIYMGGNSPTDHALSLAQKSLSSDWNDETFQEGLKQARANVKIRFNSIMNTKPAGIGGDSPYMPPQTQGGGSEIHYKIVNGQLVKQ